MAYSASKLAPGSDCGVISASSGYVKLTITLFPYYLLKMPSSPPNPPSPDANTGPANAPTTKSVGSPVGDCEPGDWNSFYIDVARRSCQSVVCEVRVDRLGDPGLLLCDTVLPVLCTGSEHTSSDYDGWSPS